MIDLMKEELNALVEVYKRISIKPKKIFRVLSILYIANFCETSKSKLCLSRGCALNNEGQKLFQLGCALN